MKLSENYGPGKFGLSFELFPPKTPAGERALAKHLKQLANFHPSYITCTYGAGGSTREKTLDIVRDVKQTFDIPTASHLTCVGSSREDLRNYLREAAALGVDYIVALRGDPPRGETEFRPAEDGLSYASELVAMIRDEFPDFGIAVAGYPEKHIEAPSLEIDLDNLKRKVDQGADVVITQLFYKNADLLRFREQCESRGIQQPVIPGILPVTSLSQVQRITAMCGAQLPDHFVSRLQEKDDADWQFQVGIEFATEQLQELLAAGIPGVHFYVLNKSRAASEVIKNVPLPVRAA